MEKKFEKAFFGDIGQSPDLMEKYVIDDNALNVVESGLCGNAKELLKRPAPDESVSGDGVLFVKNGGKVFVMGASQYKQVQFKRSICGELQDIAGMETNEELVTRLLKLEKDLSKYWGLPS